MSFWVAESGKKGKENVDAECQRGKVRVVPIATAKYQRGLNFKFMLL